MQQGPTGQEVSHCAVTNLFMMQVATTSDRVDPAAPNCLHACLLPRETLYGMDEYCFIGRYSKQNHPNWCICNPLVSYETMLVPSFFSARNLGEDKGPIAPYESSNGQDSGCWNHPLNGSNGHGRSFLLLPIKPSSLLFVSES